MSKGIDLFTFDKILDFLKKHKWLTLTEYQLYSVLSDEDFKKFLKSINLLSEDQIISLLKHDWTIIKYIENQTNPIILAAVSINSFSLQYITNQSVKACLIALKNNKDIYRYVRIVPNPDYKTTLKNLYAKKMIIDSF